MQISWVFDLNFSPSILWVKERGYIEKIAATLPETSMIRKAVARVYHYMDTFESLNDASGSPGEHVPVSRAVFNEIGK